MLLLKMTSIYRLRSITLKKKFHDHTYCIGSVYVDNRKHTRLYSALFWNIYFFIIFGICLEYIFLFYVDKIKVQTHVLEGLPRNSIVRGK